MNASSTQTWTDHASPSGTTPGPLGSFLSLLMGFEISQVLLTAHHLKVFQTLWRTPLTPPALCRDLNIPQASGERLLQTCVGLGLLEFDGETFRNGALADAYLVPEQEGYLGGLLEYYGEVFYSACTQLPNAVRENRPQVISQEGNPTDVFSAMEHQKSLVNHFLDAMHSLGLLEGKRLVSLYPFGPISRLLDLGGGSGALSITLAKAYPHLRISLFDRSEICKTARLNVEKESLGASIHVVEGDFWKDPLPTEQDAVLLSMILHDWDETRNVLLLKRAADSLVPGGKVLIYEQLLNKDGCGPLVTCLTNLTMLLRTVSGREYSEKNYSDMLSQAGFEDMRVQRTLGLRHLIVATKP
jgi:ubiquinone/menaquinone biosynthesis C-methylase UbiE